MIWKKKKAKQLPSLDELRLDRLPVLSPDALFQLLGLHNRIRNIQRIVGIDAERFEALYLEPMKRFCELAQLAPASTDYHHTAPGGLIVHTIAMVEIALHERRKYELPLRSDPEVQQQQKHQWTYAVFTGALLHDIGKLLTLCRFNMGESIFNPLGQDSLAQQCESYSIVFQKSPYSLHQRLSSVFLQIFPPVGQSFVTSNAEILEQLMGYFADSPYDWGSIGEIVRYADQQSVANDLKLGNRKRFPNSPSSPLHERLVTSLRQIIRTGGLPVNRPGAAIWVNGDYAYVVSKTGADAMRSFMHEQGATDIPNDNLRLFDSLQQFGYVLSTPEGRAIWKVEIRLADGFNQTFTVLKFETRRLFHPSNLPKDLPGVVLESEASNEDLHKIAEPISHEQQSTGAGNTLEQEKKPLAQSSGAKKESDADDQLDLPNIDKKLADISTSQSETGFVTTQPNVEMGEAFLDWVRQRIESKQFILNEGSQDGGVHILNYKNREGKTESVAGVVSPITFNRFAQENDISGGNPADIVQKSVHKLKKAIKNGKFHIHKYKIKNSPSANVTLQFYAFEIRELIPEKLDVKANDSLAFVPSKQF